jgi:hypothetical protein
VKAKAKRGETANTGIGDIVNAPRVRCRLADGSVFARITLADEDCTVVTCEEMDVCRTAWGDPDLAGVYSNDDRSRIPLECPTELGERATADITPEELAYVNRRRALSAEQPRICS